MREESRSLGGGATINWRDEMSTYRRTATALGVLAAAVLFWMENPWFNPETISPDLRTAATVSFWVLFVAVVVLLLWRGTRPQQRAAGLCLLTAAVAVALPIAADFAGARYIVGRYLLMMLPIVLVGFAIALAQTKPRWVGPAVAGLLCAGSLMVLANVVAHRWAQREDWRDAAEALGPARVDRAIVVRPAPEIPSPAPPLIALGGIYLKSVQAMPRAGRPVSEIDLLQVRGAPVYPPLAHPRPPLPGFRLVERKGNGNFELYRYVSPKPVVANPAYLNRERLLVGEELLPEHTSVGLQRASSRRDAGR